SPRPLLNLAATLQEAIHASSRSMKINAPLGQQRTSRGFQKRNPTHAGVSRPAVASRTPPQEGIFVGGGYQFVIEPSGRRKSRIGRCSSVTSATRVAFLGSNSTPRPGRVLGHSLPLRKSKCFGRCGSSRGPAPVISIKTGPEKLAHA